MYILEYQPGYYMCCFNIFNYKCVGEFGCLLYCEVDPGYEERLEENDILYGLFPSEWMANTDLLP